MLLKLEHRAVTKFLTKHRKNKKTIKEEMDSAYLESAPSLSTIQKWSSEFKRGRESIEDDPRPGRPVEASSQENIKKVGEIILEDGRVKLKSIAQRTKLSIGTVHDIIHDHLNNVKSKCEMGAANVDAASQRQAGCLLFRLSSALWWKS